MECTGFVSVSQVTVKPLTKLGVSGRAQSDRGGRGKAAKSPKQVDIVQDLAEKWLPKFEAPKLDKESVTVAMQGAASGAQQAATAAVKTSASAVGNAVYQKMDTNFKKVGIVGGLASAVIAIKAAELVPLLPETLELVGMASIALYFKSKLIDGGKKK